MQQVVPAKMEYLDVLLDFIKQSIVSSSKDAELSKPLQETIDTVQLVSDEIFSNIVKYASLPSDENVIVNIEICVNKITVEFRDNGQKFDPRQYKIPPPPRGGQNGIRMIKHLMDHHDYEYRNGQNIFTVSKNI